jgi:hypothetical protein
MNEINVELNSRKIGEYNIEDMIKMFGDRIKNVVFVWEDGNKGIDAKKMVKIIRNWKFWNKDIRLAYKNYYGLILAPFLIIERPIIKPIYNIDNEDLCNALSEELKNRYCKKRLIQNFIQ